MLYIHFVEVITDLKVVFFSGTVKKSKNPRKMQKKHKHLSSSMKSLLNNLQAKVKGGQFDLYIGGRWLRFTDMDFDVNRQKPACPQGSVLLNDTCG